MQAKDSEFRPVKSRPGLKTGLGKLDGLMDIGSGIVTLRSMNQNFLFSLVSSLLVRNHMPGAKTLYLHWVDYHKRFWTMDYDYISGAAKGLGMDPEEVASSTYFIRAFSADSVESEENWKRIFRFAKGLNFAVLDSASELYDDRPARQRLASPNNQTYALGKFSKLCMKNDCVGIVLDASKQVHPFLGSLSSVILDLRVDRGVIASVRKHPCMEEKSVEVAAWGQQSLGRWLT